MAAFTNSATVEFTVRTIVWVHEDRVPVTRVWPVRTQQTALRYGQLQR